MNASLRLGHRRVEVVLSTGAMILESETVPTGTPSATAVGFVGETTPETPAGTIVALLFR